MLLCATLCYELCAIQYRTDQGSPPLPVSVTPDINTNTNNRYHLPPSCSHLGILSPFSSLFSHYSPQGRCCGSADPTPCPSTRPTFSPFCSTVWAQGPGSYPSWRKRSCGRPRHGCVGRIWWQRWGRAWGIRTLRPLAWRYVLLFFLQSARKPRPSLTHSVLPCSISSRPFTTPTNKS
jgi:hypothetical protein